MLSKLQGIISEPWISLKFTHLGEFGFLLLLKTKLTYFFRQAFDSSKLDAPVIMSLNLIEKVDPVSDFNDVDASREDTKLKEFSCQCSEGENRHIF